MKHLFYNLVLLYLFLPISLCSADVYQWTDDKGNIHYSDIPQVTDAKRIELRNPSLYTAPVTNQPSPNNEEKPKEQTIRYSLSILSPIHEQSLHSAEGQIQVQIRLQPAMAEGMRMQIFVDGKLAHEDIQTTIVLSGLDRGSHRLQAILTDNTGQRWATSPQINFFLHKPIAAKKTPR